MGQDTKVVPDKAVLRVAIPEHIHIIGAGGVASYFLPAFIKTVCSMKRKRKTFPMIAIHDGDRLEERNLERQLFSVDEVGENKAEALCSQYEDEYPYLGVHGQYFDGATEVDKNSLLFVFVDNHAGRRAALQACDRYNCNAIIGANEYTDSQAIYYSPFYQGTELDPRVRYPEMVKDESGDPIRPAGCTTEEALAIAPQLAIANFACASYALQLFWFYYVEAPQLAAETRPHWPIEHSNNFSKITTRTEEYYANISQQRRATGTAAAAAAA